MRFQLMMLSLYLVIAPTSLAFTAANDLTGRETRITAEDCFLSISSQANFLSQLDTAKADSVQEWLYELVAERKSGDLSLAACEDMAALANAVNDDETAHSDYVMPKELRMPEESNSPEILGYRVLSMQGHELPDEVHNNLGLNTWLLGRNKFVRLSFYILLNQSEQQVSTGNQERIALIFDFLQTQIYVRPGRCHPVNRVLPDIDASLRDDLAQHMGLMPRMLEVVSNTEFKNCYDDHGRGSTMENFSAIFFKDHQHNREYFLVRSRYYSE